MPKYQLDDFPISYVGWNDDGGYGTVAVGRDGVTKIVHSEQYCGEYSIHWLEVWKGSSLTARFNAANVDSIHYEAQK